MPVEYRVSALLDSMRDTGMLPTSDESFTTARLLAVMNMEQRLYLAKLLLSAREEYQVAHADVALVAGTSRYRVPSRAIGAKLKWVALVDATGSRRYLAPAPPERELRSGAPGAGYYLEGNSIVLTDSTLTGTLRLAYFRRLGILVEAGEAGVVTAINAASRVVTLAGAPAAFTSSSLYDFVQASPHFDALAADRAATVSGNSLTFADALPSGLAVGDYVCLAGETPVCQAPLELHNVLVQRAVVKVLQAKGDPKADAAERDLEQMRVDALSLITPRIEGSPMVLVNHYAPGWSRYPRTRRGG